MIEKVKKEWFLIGMATMILLATLTSNIGKSGGVLHLETITQIGIAIVFFLHGLNLSPKAIKTGVSNWKLHIFIQFATFVFYPLLWVILGKGLLAFMPYYLAFGFCFLFALPGTISSSVTMTSVGRGNIPGAIFNASLSSVLGVFITPFLIQFFMNESGAEIDLMHSVLSISKLLLLPIFFGQILRPFIINFTSKYKHIVNKVDKYVIWLIVYNAFCDSVVKHIWTNFSVGLLATSVILCALILGTVIYSIRWGAHRLHFQVEDEIAAVFCGSKKTLAAGIPMAKVIFAADPHLGMLLLPIMLYHPMQIFYCAILANRYAKREN